MSTPPTVEIEAPTQASVAPYGWLLGKPDLVLKMPASFKVSRQCFQRTGLDSWADSRLAHSCP